MGRPAKKPMKPLTAEQRKLSEGYFGAAMRIADRKARNASPELREVIVDGAINGLMRAAFQFDPDRGVEFAWFARTFIRFGMVDALRAVGRHQPFPMTNWDICDAKPSRHTPFDRVEHDDEAGFYLRRLPPAHRRIVKLDMAGQTQATIAASLGISQGRVSAVLKESVHLCRKYHERRVLAG